MRILSTFLMAASAITMLCSAPALATSFNDAVLDENQNFVTDKRGNCVITKWVGGEDPCAMPEPEAPVAAPAPAPAPEPQTLVSKEDRTVYFGFDSAALAESEQQKLVALSQVINGSDKIGDVKIVGYTDQMGSNEYNLKLSQERVRAVQNFLSPLVKLPVSAGDVQLIGAGKAPKSSCSDVNSRAERIECMREERRVEIELRREYKQ